METRYMIVVKTG